MSEEAAESTESVECEESGSEDYHDESGVPVKSELTENEKSYDDYDTIDSITSKEGKYDKEEAKEQTNEEFSEHELEELEYRIKKGEQVDYSDHEIRKHEAKIRKELGKEGNKATSYSSRLRSLLDAISLAAKNSFDITLGKYVVDKHNKETLEGLIEGDEVFVVIHGWMQNQGAFREYVNELKSQGKKVIALGYNNPDLYGEGTKQIHEQIRDIAKKTGSKVVALGHSDGGKVLLNAAQKYGTDRYLDRIVLSQSDVNGGRNSLPLHYAVGGLPASSNLAYKEGRENILNLNSVPVDCPVYEILGNAAGSGENMGDGGVRLVDGYYKYADRRTRVTGATHFHGAGGSKPYNEIASKAAFDYGWNDLGTVNAAIGRATHKADDCKGDIFNKKDTGIAKKGWYPNVNYRRAA